MYDIIDLWVASKVSVRVSGFIISLMLTSLDCKSIKGPGVGLGVAGTAGSRTWVAVQSRGFLI